MATKREPVYKKKPGRIVGLIAVQAKDHKPGDFNPLVLTWTVDPYRKAVDFNKVVEDRQRKGQLPKYETSLFESCFKGWGAEEC